MVILMINNSFYKSSDLTNNNKRLRIKNLLNPYEYNFESNFKDRENTDISCQRSQNHAERNVNRK